MSVSVENTMSPYEFLLHYRCIQTMMTKEQRLIATPRVSPSSDSRLSASSSWHVPTDAFHARTLSSAKCSYSITPGKLSESVSHQHDEYRHCKLQTKTDVVSTQTRVGLWLLANRTNDCIYATVLCLSVCNVCIEAKRCISSKNCLKKQRGNWL